MPEINTVVIAGNLTKDPVLRKTTSGIPVANFCIATNRKFRDMNNRWQEDVCYVGVVAWSKLAESCLEKLHRGSAVLIDGELQSRLLYNEDGTTRSVVEVKAHRIQFLNKAEFHDGEMGEEGATRAISECNTPASLDEIERIAQYEQQSVNR
jgi:single-strand DNA-binding protein